MLPLESRSKSTYLDDIINGISRAVRMIDSEPIAERNLMPSPFPGMDPYLEKPSRWPGVHHELISVIGATLTELLRPKYFVEVGERVYLSTGDDPGRTVLVPDVHISRLERAESDRLRVMSTVSEPMSRSH